MLSTLIPSQTISAVRNRGSMRKEKLGVEDKVGGVNTEVILEPIKNR